MTLCSFRPLAAGLAAVAALFAAGCAGKHPAVPVVAEPSAPSTMRCGDQLIRVAFAGEQARLEVGGETFELEQVMAASGARYVAASDPATSLWSKGDRVRLTLRGKEYPECSLVAAAAALPGAEWVVEDIGGGGIIDRSRATLAFSADGRVAGTASCNSYGAGYTARGDSLSFTQAAATLKACAPALMAQEEKFMSILGDVRTYSIGADGALILRTADGRTITARRG